MNITQPIKTIINTLREQAEAVIGTQTSFGTKKNTETDLPSLLYELEVHQVELELQNEELRIAQLQLANEHDRYLELYEHAPVAYLALGAGGEIHGANLKAEEAFSLPRRSMHGKKVSNFVSKSSQDDLYLHLKAMLTATSKQSVELKLKGEGPIEYLRIESLAVVSHNDKRTHSHTVLIDITAQRQAKEALLKVNHSLEEKVAARTKALTQHNARLSSILNAASDAIITCDARGLIQAINPVTAVMFGYGESELIGSHIATLVPESHFHINGDCLQVYEGNCAPDLSLGVRELIAEHKNGTLFPVSLSVNKMEGFPYFTCIIRDVSQRVELEKQVLACIEEERNRISRDLHDSLGQTLVGISMQARSMAARFQEKQIEGWEKIKLFGEDLDEVAKSVRSIVSDLALFDMDEPGQLVDIINIMINNYRRYSDVSIETDIPETLAIDSSQVANQLIRIMQEGINNALKHAKAERIYLQIIQDQTRTKLSISDDGIGLNKNLRKKRKVTSMIGCGRGLNNMRYRAHIIGANLEISSNENSGTSIHCTVIR